MKGVGLFTSLIYFNNYAVNLAYNSEISDAVINTDILWINVKHAGINDIKILYLSFLIIILSLIII